MKRLIVCCDGTWNRADQTSPTNVVKLKAAVAERDADGVVQRVHYEPGVGTRPRERFVGGGLGVGLSQNVRSCYRFLVDSYEPGDELYFFGFSRGAFTARSTAGFVRNAGILRREERGRVDEAYALYRSRDDARKPSGAIAERFRADYSHPDTPIHFIGVWDTVGSLGIPIPLLPSFITRRWTFHDTELSRSVRNAYHALAIDEQRGPFKPTLWTQHPEAHDQVLQQRWFAGVHCDVGGGYPETALSEIPLQWIAEQRARLRPRARPRGGRGRARPAARLLHRLLPPAAAPRPPTRRHRRGLDLPDRRRPLRGCRPRSRRTCRAPSPPGGTRWLRQ